MIDRNFRSRCKTTLATGSLLLLFALLLSGCAASGTASVAKAYQPQPGEPVGWLAGSLAARGGEFGSFSGNSVDFRLVGGKHAGNFYLYVVGTMDGYPPKIDLVEGNNFLQTYLVPMKPGRYEVYAGSMSTDTGMASFSVNSKKNQVSLPFQIEAGKVTYLGAFTTESFGGKNLFGQRIRAGAYFVVTNERERDLALLAKKGVMPDPAVEVVEAVPAFELQDIFVRAPMLDGKGLSARLGMFD